MFTGLILMAVGLLGLCMELFSFEVGGSLLTLSAVAGWIGAECIDYIYQGNELFYGKEQTQEELLDFINNLTSEQFAKVQKFFETMPRLKQEVNYNCPVCNRAHHKVLEGLQSFF